MYPKCQYNSCNKPMRPRGTLLADHPGTVVQHSAKICSSCYQKRSAHEERKALAHAHDPLDTATLQRMEQVSRATAAYIRSRRTAPEPVPARGLDRVEPIRFGRPRERSLANG